MEIFTVWNTSLLFANVSDTTSLGLKEYSSITRFVKKMEREKKEHSTTRHKVGHIYATLEIISPNKKTVWGRTNRTNGLS